MKRCRVIVRAGIGYDNIDILEAKKRNIVVCNVPDYCTEEVADQTVAFILSLVRALPEHAEEVKKGRWKRKSPMTYRIKGKVLGIIGLGRIGSAVARRATGFGLEIVFYDPYIKEGYDKVFDARRVDTLDDLARISDIVSVHAPLTEETRGMINEAFFAKAKKGMVFVNTARGPIAELNALEKAMREGTVMAAGLDVLDVEPPDGTRKLITDYMNGAEWLKGRLIVTPHSAFYSHEAMDEVRLKSAQEAKRVLQGEMPRNCVNDLFI
jgi:lactate dehydrogenase-like 2-hydroxyacid dehydrogenase